MSKALRERELTGKTCATPADRALSVLEAITPAEWQALGQLATTHTAGRLSYEAWQAAASATIERAARRA